MSRYARHHMDRAPIVPPETSYLIEDVAELVNDRVDVFLENAPFHIKASGFHPELLHGDEALHGITALGQKYLPHAYTGRDFTGMDLDFAFPIRFTDKNPLKITVNWSDATNLQLAFRDSRPILIAGESGDSGKTFMSAILHPEIMANHLDTLSLPDSFWKDDIGEITRDLYNCPELLMTRTAKTQVDLATTLEIVHDARIAQDVDDTKQLLQELCINVDHDLPARPAATGELPLKPFARYRNMLRFSRTSDDSAWQFAGAYRGHLDTGDLIDDIVQVDPKLGIPSSKVLDKALAVLSQLERTK